MNRTSSIRVAAAVAFLGIVLGAFGAHGLENRLEATGRADNFETAVLYHLIHAAALFAAAVSATKLSPWASRLWLAGILLFSGSLYILALTGITWLGAITPLGGLAFLAGWGILVFAPQCCSGEKT